MRKFSKKIAMMMVLAMLVSLFSGIVSASAASIWSAKSVDDDNYAVVMGETIEVKKGEFINFDLFKGDVEATKAGYTYTWESSDAEVLFINGAEGAKNGYARVKGEAGEKATISVSFTNLATGVTVKTPRTFNVVVVDELKADEAEVAYDIIAKFGEESFVAGKEEELAAVVTADGKEVEAEIAFAVNGKTIEGKYVPAVGDAEIVITATVDGKEITETVDIVVEEKAVASVIVDVKQKNAKTVEITFDAAITQAEAEKIELFQDTLNKNIYKKSAVAKDNVVTYTSYKDFGNKIEWIFKYAESEFEFTSSQGAVDLVVIVGPEVVYTEPVDADKKLVDIEVKFYDELGVEVAKPDKAWIEWKVSDDKIARTVGDKIEGLKADEIVSLYGIYHSNEYDANNNYKEFTFDIAGKDVKVLKSDAASIVKVSSAVIGTASDKTVPQLPASSAEYYLFVKFLKTDGKEVAAADLDTTKFKYESTDESKLIVDPTSGLLIPLTTNATVDVIVNYDKEMLGVVAVNIGPAVAATPPKFTPYKTVSNSTEGLADKAEFKFEGKTNYGADVTYYIKDYKVLSMPGTNADEAKADVKKDFISKNGASVFVTPVVGAGEDQKVMTTGSYIIEVEVANTTDDQTWKNNVSVYVQDAAGDLVVKYVELIADKAEYDTTITEKTESLAGAITYKIVGYNKSMIAIKTIDAADCTITVKLNNKDDVALDKLALYQAVTGGSIVVDDVAYKALDNGVYTFEGSYGDIKFSKPVNVTVKGAQAAPSISFEKNEVELVAGTVSTGLAAELAKCFAAPDTTNNNDYKYEGLAVSLDDVKTTAKDASAAGTYAVYVDSVTVTQRFVKSGIEVTFKVPVKKNVTLNIKAE